MKRFIIASIIFALFIIIILPMVAEATSEKLGDVALPDTRLFYTSEEIYQVADEVGEAGRSYYVRQRITFDLVWPLVYAWFLFTGIAFIYQTSSRPAISLGASWFPILALVFDYLENGLASIVMLLYPTQIDALTKWLPVATVLKWSCIALSSLLLVGGVLIKFVEFSRKREKEKWAKENQE